MWAIRASEHFFQKSKKLIPRETASVKIKRPNPFVPQVPKIITLHPSGGKEPGESPDNGLSRHRCEKRCPVSRFQNRSRSLTPQVLREFQRESEYTVSRSTPHSSPGDPFNVLTKRKSTPIFENEFQFQKEGPVKKARDVFEKYLSQSALRLTPQRSLVLETFLSNEGHLTTEEIYGLVKMKDSTVGYTTVYRTLKLLSESGIAREVDFGDGFQRYEHEFGHDHHDHLICERCKKSVEVLDPEIEVLQEKLARKHGFKISTHRMDIFGICRDCKGKE